MRLCGENDFGATRQAMARDGGRDDGFHMTRAAFIAPRRASQPRRAAGCHAACRNQAALGAGILARQTSR